MPQRYIDGFEFCGTGGVVSGKWPVADLPRLQDMLRDAAGAVDYRIVGTRDGVGRPALEVCVAGVLQLTCQRCLEALAYRFDARSMLVLARSQAEIEADDLSGADGPERILAGVEMPVRDLIEDEVLLLVPLAPRHDVCARRPEVAAAGRNVPFAGLRGLLDGGKTD